MQRIVMSAWLLLAFAGCAASADDFYKGKTITIINSTGNGGSYYNIAQALARTRRAEAVALAQRVIHQALMAAQMQLAGPFLQAYMTAANTAATWWMTQLAPVAKEVAPGPQAPVVAEEPVEAAPAEPVVAPAEPVVATVEAATVEAAPAEAAVTQAVAVEEPGVPATAKPAPKPRARKAKAAATA